MNLSIDLHTNRQRGLTAFWYGVLATSAVTLGPTASALDWSGDDLTGAPCEIVQGPAGPWDYTNPEHVRDELPVVTRAHFSPQVENLISGQSGHSIQADLYYTLEAFPNHHRALHALVRYQLSSDTSRPKLQIAPECFLDRATAFKPSDGNVHLIYGIYLHRLGKLEEAEKKYKLAESVSGSRASADLYYNLGLLYVDMEDYEAARHYARLAYDRKHPLTGLRDILRRRGHPL